MLDDWALNQNRLKKRLYFRLIAAGILKRAASIHALTETEARNVRELGISTSVVNVPNGIDLAEFENLPSRTAFCERFPQLRGKRIVLFLGRLHPKKGIDLLIETFAEVATLFPDLFLVLAGPDAAGTRKRAEDQLQALQCQGRFLFTGILDRKECLEAFAAADIFVLPSYSEGLPMSALEALAAGVPVIVSSSCNLPQVEKQEAGLVIKLERKSLLRALTILCGDEALRQRMGLNARSYFLTNYSWDQVAVRMTRVYENILRQSQAGTSLCTSSA
jgi:glycosyltransferase involved in cell wall biosynthesis